jgi:hypothetical protein
MNCTWKLVINKCILFQEDVDSFMKDCEGVEGVLRDLDEKHGMTVLDRKKRACLIDEFFFNSM